MNFNEYQKEAAKTAIYPKRGENLSYCALGLVGEAGEIANKAKKIIRGDDGGVLTDEKKAGMADELGDVLWYMSELASTLDTTLEEVAKKNIAKLHSRQERGVLKGSGDNR